MLGFELGDLPSQVVDDAINLPDHRLLNDLYFNADFDCGYRPALYGVSRLHDRRDIRNDLTETSVTATRLHALAHVLNVQNRQALVYAADVLARSAEVVEVFVELSRYVVALRC